MTIFAEVRALLIGLEPLKGVWRTAWVPRGAEFPYVSILDPISEVPELEGDGGTKALRRLLQVDLWQTEEAEDDTLPDRLRTALDGVQITGCFRLRVLDSPLIPEDDNIVHRAMTVSLARMT